ncbi:MAG: fused response regulator/phosphatase [Melioribacteraceae bacterium]|nr:fused response regulator/phosphatase [Melioribacteraceae bacterium]
MESGSNTNYKILLVEDEANVALLFKYNLTKSGFNVEVGTNGKEGLSLVKSYKPDLILSDIMMPEMDGFEFRRNLLKDDEVKNIPFVFLTAKSSEEDMDEGYDLDIEDYIIKTSSPKIVIKKILAILKSLEKEREKIVGEINKAADSMHAKVVPDSFPVFDGFVIKHWHQPFENIPGGDFIDYVQLNEDKIVIVLGDVMGKKWGAWYFAYAYSGYVRSAIRMVLETTDDYKPSTIMKKVNDSVYEDERISEVFTTLSIVILDKKEKKLNYTGAGDLPLMIKRKSESEPELIKSNGLLLGFNKDSNFKDVEVEINSGDCVVLTTDGITESRNKEKIQFSENGILAVLKTFNPENDPTEIIKNAITVYTDGNYEDDMSLITIKAL